MKSRKLMSSIERGKLLKNVSDSEYRRRREQFDNFLEKKLTLGDLVACGKDGKPLEEPTGIHLTNMEGSIEAGRLSDEYQQAKERVLFDFDFGFSQNKGMEIELFKTIKKSYPNIEDLIDYDEITLTESAIKNLGL